MVDQKELAEWAKNFLRVNLDETPGSYGGSGYVTVYLDVFDGEEWVNISQGCIDLPDID